MYCYVQVFSFSAVTPFTQVSIVSDVDILVLKRDVKLQPTTEVMKGTWSVNVEVFKASVITTTTPQPFYGPFSGTSPVSQCQKRTPGLYGARKD